MIGSCITSLLVVVTSTICEAFQPTSHRLYDKTFRFQNRAVSQRRLAIPHLPRSNVMTPLECRVQNRRRGRYMIGDLMVLNRGGDASRDCRQLCCSWPNLFTTSSRAFRKTSEATATELYCLSIDPDADIAKEDDGPITTGDIGAHNTTTTTWKKTFLQFSTLASILCVIDCTILPILMVILPLLGMVSAVQTILPLNHVVHHYGHVMTIYFVLPTGFLATTINYCYNHRKKWIPAIGWFGLLLIFAANSGSGGCGSVVAAEHLSHAHHHHHLATSITKWDGMIHLVSSIRNTIQHGMYHRITNLSGCAFLILSNYISHQYQKNHRRTHGKDCCAPLP